MATGHDPGCRFGQDFLSGRRAAVSEAARGLDPDRCVRCRSLSREDWPTHKPIAPDAPIPGRHWYAGCDPDGPRVGSDGICEGCGAVACPDCGHGRYSDGKCGCP